MINDTFYPTPLFLAHRMLGKLVNKPKRVLEPSAGKGDLMKVIHEKYKDYHFNFDISCIEKEPVLQATLRGLEYKVIDSDFLEYAGPDQFDAIIANPPFDEGDKHLLKAIEIMYRGEIVFLLNAETLKNPHTNSRKLLAQKIEEYHGTVEYVQNAFIDAERKTGVEVAIVHLHIDNTVDDSLFAGCDDSAARSYDTVKDKHEVSTGRTIEELVLEYNELITAGTDMILHFFNTPKAWRYLSLDGLDEKHSQLADKDKTAIMQGKINRLLGAARTDFWRKTLNLDAVRSRLTAKKKAEFEIAVAANCFMDFTEKNIRQFVLNLIASTEETLIAATLDIFELMTEHSFGRYGDKECEKNVHLFSGWKTNDSFKVNEKVIIPFYYEAFFRNAKYSWAKWDLNYQVKDRLHDIDLVMSYFDGGGHYVSICQALEAAFKDSWHGSTMNKIQSTFFTISVFKKNTIHLTFRDKDILRRFNVVACKGKSWLPDGYGEKAYNDMDYEEKEVVAAFEGAKSYIEKQGQPLFANVSTQLLLTAA